MLLGGLAWLVPGVGYASLLHRGFPLAPRLHHAAIWWAVPALVCALGIPLGVLGLSPVALVLTVVAPGLLLALRPAAWSGLPGGPRSTVVGLLGLPLLIAVLAGLLPSEPGLTSDVHAHVAAVRSTIEEQAVFPVEGFHGDAESRGADARFGVVHAIHGAASQLGGTEPLVTWYRLRGASLLLILVGGLALLEALRVSRLATAIGFLGVLFAYGGSYYNPLEVAMYPLWFGLGLMWTLLALLLAVGANSPLRLGLVGGLGVVALLGIHFFAFALGAFLLLTAVVSAPAAARAGCLRALGLAILVAAPLLAVRIDVSYANANPIHQRVWECFQWAPGLYSANPIFLAKWMFLPGAIALVWGLFRYRALAEKWRGRWMLVASGLALTWLCVPFLLTPSMSLLGFLPLRMVMAIPVPFLLAYLLDRTIASPGRRAGVAALLLLAMLPLAVTRVQAVVGDHHLDSAMDGPAWSGMLAELTGDEDMPRLLSDPFSMMAVRAMAPAYVVAVPDGRSSPRDPIAVDRLRDAWRAMSPSTDAATTLAVLREHEATHVLVNETLPGGLASYEYPIHPASAPLQRAKFDAAGAPFTLVYEEDGLALYRLEGGDAPEWDESYRAPCLLDSRPAGETLALGHGYQLHSPRAALETGEDGNVRLRLSGVVTWDGPTSAPDRQLVVRMDRVDTPVPDALQWMQKPVRKLLEAAGRGTWRYRWTTYPGRGRCPLWTVGEGGAIPLEVVLGVPSSATPGTYRVHLAAADLTVFTPIRVRDLLKDDDSYQGPAVGTVEVR